MHQCKYDLVIASTYSKDKITGVLFWSIIQSSNRRCDKIIDRKRRSEEKEILGKAQHVRNSKQITNQEEKHACKTRKQITNQESRIPAPCGPAPRLLNKKGIKNSKAHMHCKGKFRLFFFQIRIIPNSNRNELREEK